ncbi:uncharacterized protein Tco025E_03501, partial [Trypanosoma conorhini]
SLAWRRVKAAPQSKTELRQRTQRAASRPPHAIVGLRWRGGGRASLARVGETMPPTAPSTPHRGGRGAERSGPAGRLRAAHGHLPREGKRGTMNQRGGSARSVCPAC